MLNHPDQLSNLSAAEAAEALAEVAVLNRRLRAKSAGWQDTLQAGGKAVADSVRNFATSDDPTTTTARHGLLGAAIGAGAGGIAAMSQPKERRRTLRSLASGALLGGAAGTGLSLLNSGSAEVSRTPDGGLTKALAKAQRDLRTAAAQGHTPEMLKPYQDSVAELESRIKALPPEALAAERADPGYPNMLTRGLNAAENLWHGEPVNAASSFAPNPGMAAVGGTAGGAAGYAAGAAVDNHRASQLSPGEKLQRLQALGHGDVKDVVTAASAPHTPDTVYRELLGLRTAPKGAPLPAGVRAHEPQLLSKSKMPAKVPGKGFRRLGGGVGMFLGGLAAGGLGPNAYSASNY